MRLTGLAVFALVTACSSPFGPRGTPCGEYRATSGKGTVLDASGTVLFQDAVETPSFSHAFFLSQNVLAADPARVRSALIAGALRVELTTDESPARTLSVPVTLTMAGDWYTLRCL